MPTPAKNTFGNTLFMAPAGTAPVRIANLRMVEEPELKRGFNDVVSHDSTGGALEWLPEGVYEVGEFGVEGDYIPLSTGDAAIRTAFGSTNPPLQDFKITSKSAAGAAELKGSGYVSSYKVEKYDVKGFQQFSMKIRPTGLWTVAAGA